MSRRGEFCYFSGLFDKPLQGKIGVVKKDLVGKVIVEPVEKIAGVDEVTGQQSYFIFHDEKKANNFDLNELKKLNLNTKNTTNDMHKECQFLMERLKEFSLQIGGGEEYRNWSGHVAPSIARIEQMLDREH